MAKAAVRAGVEILWKKMGQPRIRQVYLAGGFGYYLDVEAAFRIGLLPVSMRGRVTAAGNTSLAQEVPSCPEEEHLRIPTDTAPL